MRKLLQILFFAAMTSTPALGQVKASIDRASLYSDTVLRQLLKASQFAIDRRKTVVRRSGSRQNETAGIRRSSTLSTSDQAQLERLSAFSGERLRTLEQLSEFREQEVQRMQAAYQPELSSGQDNNRIAQIADRDSILPRLQLEKMLRDSEAREWARHVHNRVVAIGSYANLLQRRSAPSRMEGSAIKNLSLDK